MNGNLYQDGNNILISTTTSIKISNYWNNRIHNKKEFFLCIFASFPFQSYNMYEPVFLGSEPLVVVIFKDQYSVQKEKV